MSKRTLESLDDGSEPVRVPIDHRGSKRASRRYYRSTVDERCRACGQVIPAGCKMALGLTQEPYHASCKRLRVVPVVEVRRPETSPFKDVQFTPRPCGGCGDLMLPGEQAVHMQGLPWHQECRIRESHM